MATKILQAVLCVMVVLLTGCGEKDTTAPEVVATNPPNGAQNVDPALREISVTFNEPMADKSWSWTSRDQNSFPHMDGQPSYNEDMTKNTLPVKLEPGKEYVIWINSVNYTGFRDQAGNPVKPYQWTFKTR